MQEAILYERAEENAVNCYLCSRRCRISDGRRGFCGVRQNRGGTLYSLVYGRLIAQHVDPIEKKPLYHFLPNTRSYSIATPGCNFRCPFCQNWQISQTDPEMEFDRLPYTEPQEVVEKALKTGCKSIAHTYTEPTIFMEYALDVAALGAKHGLKNVFVTNGYQTPEAIEAMRGKIDAANVDLKAFSEEFYREQCRARLKPVLETIANMHGAGIHVEVTTLVVPGQNDSEEELRHIAEFVAGLSPDMPWHISRFHPDYKVTDIPPTPEATLRRAFQIAREAGLRYAYVGNVILEGAQDTVCPDCGRVVIRRFGLTGISVDLRDGKCPGCGKELPIVLQ